MRGNVLVEVGVFTIGDHKEPYSAMSDLELEKVEDPVSLNCAGLSASQLFVEKRSVSIGQPAIR